MKAIILQQRIESNLFTKTGVLAAKYEKVISFLIRGGRVHPFRWTYSGYRHKLIGDDKHYTDALTAIGIDYTTGNDAPRGGANGFFIELTAKGKRQVAEWVKLNTPQK